MGRPTKATLQKQPPKKRANKTPPFPNYPEWSTAKFFGFLRSGLRATYNKWPAKWQVLKESKRPYQGKGKQQKWEFQCAVCKCWHKQKDISIDHITPAGSLNTYDDIAGFVERLFIGPEGLQTLCKECHNKKTLLERQGNIKP